jgi:methionyl-tRNA formyltransferase
MKINGQQNLKSIKKKVLFCGKKNDKYSKKIIQFLRKKKINLKILLTSSEKKIKKKQSDLIYSNMYDFILCFRSKIVIKIKKINKQCIPINFHPGPPNYRGIGCANFALLNNEKKYGATAHVMRDIIDYGPILDVSMFKISNNLNLESVLDKTYKIQLIQFKKLINKLLANKFELKNAIKKNKNIKWSKKLFLRKDLINLYNLSNNVNKYKLENLIRATITKKYKPYFKVQNMLFKL